MEAIFTIAITLVFLAAAGIVLFLVTIQPIWAIIDVAIARDKSTGEKVVWIVLVFITWTLGSLIYGLVFATRPLAVTTRVLVAVLLVLILLGVAIAIAAPLTIEQLRDSIRRRRFEPVAFKMEHESSDPLHLSGARPGAGGSLDRGVRISVV